MKVANARAVLTAALLWLAGLAWLWPRAVRAESLSDEARLYDWASLLYAGGLGLAGGLLALIVALATERRVVREVAAEGARNAIVSPIAGAGSYMVLKAFASLGWFTVSTEPRFLLIVIAGYAGIAAVQWARGIVGEAAGEVRDRILKKGAEHDQ